MTLTLPVNKFYFNQVKNKELIEDFRAIKPYWIKRLVKNEFKHLEGWDLVNKYVEMKGDIFKTFEEIIFQMGYNENSPIVKTKFKGIRLTHPDEITCMGTGLITFAIEIEYLK